MDGFGVSSPERSSGLQLRSRLTGACNFFNVTVVRSAAASQHVDLRMPAQQIGILATKFARIAVVEVGRLIELCMAELRGIGAGGNRSVPPKPPRHTSTPQP